MLKYGQRMWAEGRPIPGTLSSALDPVANAYGLAVPELLLAPFPKAFIRIVPKIGHCRGCAT